MSDMKVATAEQVRNRNWYYFDVRPDMRFRLRVLDMTTIVMNNLIPFHLLKAAQKFEDVSGGGSPEEQTKRATENLDPQEIQQYVEFLKHYACTVVLEPRLSPVPTDDPKVLFVGELNGDDLMAIFSARPPAKEGEQKEVPRVTSPELAEDFRRETPVPSHQNEPSGKSLRGDAKLVDFPDREALHQ